MSNTFTAAAWEHWESHPDRLTATPSMAYGIAAEWARDHLAAHDARVRRDGAREALDGLAESHPFGADVFLLTEYRDTHYPEETP